MRYLLTILLLLTGVFTQAQTKPLPNAPVPKYTAEELAEVGYAPIHHYWFDKWLANDHPRVWYKPWTILGTNATPEQWVERNRALRGRDHWYTDKKEWLGTAAYTGCLLPDAIETAKKAGQYPYYVETNKFLGPHPSNGAIAGYFGAKFGILFGLHIWEWKTSHFEPERGWRAFGYLAMPIIGCGMQAHADYYQLTH